MNFVSPVESSDLSPDDSSDYTDDTDDTDDDEDAVIDLHAQIEPFREALREERHLHHETSQKLEDLRVSNHKLMTELQEDRDEIKYLKETLKSLMAGSKVRDELLKSELAQNEIEKVMDTDQAKEKNTQGGSDKKEKVMRTKFKHAPDTVTSNKDVAKYVQQLKDLHEEVEALRHENIELRAANKKITRQYEDNLHNAKRKATKYLLERWRFTIFAMASRCSSKDYGALEIAYQKRKAQATNDVPKEAIR